MRLISSTFTVPTLSLAPEGGEGEGEGGCYHFIKLISSTFTVLKFR
jgi:hypothetical protein